MAIRVQMGIGLRDERGVVFGTLRQVSNRHLKVDIAADYPQGAQLEFQFALDGYRASALGQASVEKVLVDELGLGTSSYLLAIGSLDEHSQPVFREWLYDQAQGGGTASRPHERLISSIARAKADPERVREGQRRLEALDDARARRSTTSVVSSVTGASSSTRTGVGRAALRQALRGWGDQPAGSVSSRPSPEASRPSSLDRSVAPGVLPLEVRLSESAEPPRILVRFHDRRRFLDMFRDHLDRDMLFLRLEGASLTSGTAVAVRMAFPGGDILLSHGLVLAVLPSGIAIQLRLSAEDRGQVREAATSCQRALDRA
ncbi:MAG: hypothetical protein ABIO70_02230 [Pseudomonadota bacterium]